MSDNVSTFKVGCISPISEAMLMVIELISVDELKAAPYNPRKDLQPGDAEYEKIKRSLNEFSLVIPIVWNKRTKHVVGGHQRLKVLMSEGATEVYVSVVDIPLAREKSLNIALNKVSGEWEKESLIDLLSDLVADPEAPFDATGFEEDFMNEFEAEEDIAELLAVIEADEAEVEEELEEEEDLFPKKGLPPDQLCFAEVRVKMSQPEIDHMLDRYLEWKQLGDGLGFVSWLFSLE